MIYVVRHVRLNIDLSSNNVKPLWGT